MELISIILILQSIDLLQNLYSKTNRMKMQWPNTSRPFQQLSKLQTASESRFQPYCQVWQVHSPKVTLPPLKSQSKFNRSKSNLDYLFDTLNDQNNTEQIDCLKFISIPKPIKFPSLNDFNQLSFPVLCYSIQEQINLSKAIFDLSTQRQLLSRNFNLQKLIQLIAQNYQLVPYHNFSHAFSVLLMLFQVYNRSEKLKRCLTEKQWFFVFLATLIHDLNHPGTTNSFEIKKKSKYALQGKNKAVLQKMHLNHFWNLINNNGQVNFLQGYPSYEAKEIKQLITRMVLSTDTSKHNAGIEKLAQIRKSEQSLVRETALIVVEKVFHACDIGNPCLEFERYMSWSALINIEFNDVARKEKENGFKVTSYYKYENLNTFYDRQICFCQKFVFPLWKEISTMFPELEEMSNNILKNIEELERRKEENSQ